MRRLPDYRRGYHSHKPRKRFFDSGWYALIVFILILFGYWFAEYIE